MGEEVERERGITRKKITLGDGCIDLIIPTQAFNNQQEGELNGWSGGGEKIK